MNFARKIVAFIGVSLLIGSVLAADSRSIVLLDMKDIKNKSSSRMEVDDFSEIGEALESMLVRLDFRVLSKASIARSVEERKLFNSLLEGKMDDLEVEAPAYRIEAIIYQYGVDSPPPQTSHSQANGIWEKKKILKLNARVELAVKFVNIRTGETEFSTERILREKSDQRVTKSFVAKGGPMAMDHVNDTTPMSGEKLLAKALEESLLGLAKEICLKLKPFNILECSDNGEILCDAPAIIVKEGDLLNVYALGKAKASRSGKVYRAETLVAVLEVKATTEESCTAVIKDVIDVNCNWDVIVRPQGCKVK